jgi:hypothetical protein
MIELHPVNPETLAAAGDQDWRVRPPEALRHVQRPRHRHVLAVAALLKGAPHVMALGNSQADVAATRTARLVRLMICSPAWQS